VVAGFADNRYVGSVDPLKIPHIAAQAGAHVGMIDTAIKDGTNLLQHLSLDSLTHFVRRCHARGMEAAFAGSLKKAHFAVLAKTGADIFGVRGAVCTGYKRTGRLQKSLLKQLLIQANAHKTSQ
jgi:(5-formylfuran-3-yl)methyl phosphate synthase